LFTSIRYLLKYIYTYSLLSTAKSQARNFQIDYFLLESMA